MLFSTYVLYYVYIVHADDMGRQCLLKISNPPVCIRNKKVHHRNIRLAKHIAVVAQSVEAAPNTICQISSTFQIVILHLDLHLHPHKDQSRTR